MSVLIKNMEIPEHCGYCRFRYDGICHALQKTKYSVKECPLVSVNDIKTVQPEIVRCKDCKHRPDGTGVNHDLEFPDDRCPCKCEDYWYSWKPDDNWFCGNGERRE